MSTYNCKNQTVHALKIKEVQYTQHISYACFCDSPPLLRVALPDVVSAKAVHSIAQSHCGIYVYSQQHTQTSK